MTVTHTYWKVFENQRTLRGKLLTSNTEEAEGQAEEDETTSPLDDRYF